MGLGWTILHALWLFLPAYVANMAPVFVGGPPPIDGGRVWKDGRRVLGDGKTWRGLFLAPLVGAFLALGMQWIALHARWGVPQEEGGFGFATLGESYAVAFVMAYVFGWGALVGDAVESFFKRRRGMDRGARWLGFDQLDFVAGAFAIGLLVATLLHAVGATRENWITARWTWPTFLAIVVLTPALHLLVNFIGYKIGKKDVPW